MPVIGITPSGRLSDYIESIRRAGGEPQVLAADRAPSLEGLDGLLFTGGDDIDPARYGQPRHEATAGIDQGRDDFEIALVREAIARDMPMLAICRGLQIVNVAEGGTLVQDIPTQVTQALAHRVDAPLFAIAHEVWVTPGSTLARIMAEEIEDGEVLQVNSRHHQAIERLAAGFDVAATAPDGVIEAIERPGARFCLGVQWHPENFWRTGEFRALFEAFVEACDAR